MYILNQRHRPFRSKSNLWMYVLVMDVSIAIFLCWLAVYLKAIY